jgi:hypothetical protein
MVLCIRIKLHLHLWYRSEPLTFRLQFPTPRFLPTLCFLFICMSPSVCPPVCTFYCHTSSLCVFR